MSDTLNTLSSLLVVVICAYVGIAFVRAIWRRKSGAVYHFSAFVILMLLAYAGRSFYWDAARFFMPADTWSSIMDLLGGRLVNIAFDFCALMACYHALRAAHLLIPPDEKDAWHWAASGMYPPWAWVSRITGAVKRRK